MSTPIANLRYRIDLTDLSEGQCVHARLPHGANLYFTRRGDVVEVESEDRRGVLYKRMRVPCPPHRVHAIPLQARDTGTDQLVKKKGT